MDEAICPGLYLGKRTKLWSGVWQTPETTKKKSYLSSATNPCKYALPVPLENIYDRAFTQIFLFKVSTNPSSANISEYFSILGAKETIIAVDGDVG